MRLHRRQRRRGCRGRDPQYLTCRGRPVLATSQYFDKCFIFFSFSGTWNGFASLYRSLGTNSYFYKVYDITAIHATHES